MVSPFHKAFVTHFTFDKVSKLHPSPEIVYYRERRLSNCI